MRLWSLHPEYLDGKGLVALWRESILAQKILMGKINAYKNHPQLIRFRKSREPIVLINIYLLEIYKEAKRRGYKFDINKIIGIGLNTREKILVTEKQVEYEFQLLKHKLQKRDRSKLREISMEKGIKLNRIFKEIPGEIEEWERQKIIG